MPFVMACTKTKTWNNIYIFITMFQPLRWLITFKHMICIKTLLEKCRSFKNTVENVFCRLLLHYVVYLILLILALLILFIKNTRWAFLVTSLIFFFMLEKIVITPNLEVQHIYIIRLQLVFNCTPFVNLMALLNWTIIIIIIITGIVGVAKQFVVYIYIYVYIYIPVYVFSSQFISL